MADLQPKAFDGMALELVAIPLKGNPGEQGDPGNRGDPGKTNYQLWLEAGNTGSLDDFLEWSKGQDGEDGRPMVSRGRWEVGVYNPGEFVVAQGTATTSSLWFVIGDMSIISSVPPRLEEPGIWSQAPLPAGEPGTKWVILNGVPDLGDGDVGDYYLDLDTGDIYGPKAENDWGPVIGNLAGEDSDVLSVNGRVGDVVITAVDLNLATVATSGAYVDLQDKPTLGTAAALPTEDFVMANRVGVANGVVPLDPDAKIAAAYLPSYVDDVLEYASLAAFPATGEQGKIYVAVDTGRIYRWGGTLYIRIAASPGTTDEVPEGVVNKYFTDARAIAAAPVQSVNGKAGTVILVPADIGAVSLTGNQDIAGSKKFLNPSSWQLAPNLRMEFATPAGRAGLAMFSGAAGVEDRGDISVGASFIYVTAPSGTQNGLTGQSLAISNTVVRSTANNLVDLGATAQRWATVHANTYSVNTAVTFTSTTARDASRLALAAVGTSGDESIGGVKTMTAKTVFAAGARLGLNQMMEFGDGTSVYGSIRPTSQGTMVIAAGPVGASPGPRLLLRPRGDAVSTGQLELTTNGALVFDSPAAQDSTRRNLSLPITISATAPASPQEGDVWIDIS